jgi:hypothetical protein
MAVQVDRLERWCSLLALPPLGLLDPFHCSLVMLLVELEEKSICLLVLVILVLEAEFSPELDHPVTALEDL